jgi:hypothetical protein
MGSPDCAAVWKLVVWRMPQENEPRPENDSTESQSGNIRERVEELRAKTNQLSQAFDRVEKSLREAAGESRE